ncbi:dead box ATP-dependent RNA helicase [Reticulomyxa filosa]|uniref:Dead box ATP-dependent RNA helicase n=1 Tax=Reticulomyxa filosa TaxID=46433 RepID=X6NTM6_RETFI|nr:dead box ATP-dependent RNA helicase [Reticulomyxa filosa]|eukprot:ETO28652.1 dead box ATP-dependent RNA helicase [Reticulomyxa filosa]
MSNSNELSGPNNSYILQDKVSFGVIPPFRLNTFHETMLESIRKDLDMQQLIDTCTKAEQLYKKTRQKPTKYALRKYKEINCTNIHPIFAKDTHSDEIFQHQFVNSISNFKPQAVSTKTFI